MRFPFKGLFGPINFILFLGIFCTLLLAILTGFSTKHSMDKFYWLETDCAQIPPANIDGLCRWTNYGICQVSNGNNVNCTKNSAAYPFDPARNFNGNEGLPDQFQSRSSKFYYMSRFGYVFKLIAIFFLFLAFLGLIVYTFASAAWIAGFYWASLILSFIFLVPALALTTATFVQGRNAFRDIGYHTSLGVKSMAVQWTSLACLLLVIFFSCFMGISAKKRYAATATETTAVKTSRGGWFKRNDIPAQDQIVGGPAAPATANPHTFIGIKKKTKVTPIDETAI